jgi:hypothetical protein
LDTLESIKSNPIESKENRSKRQRDKELEICRRRRRRRGPRSLWTSSLLPPPSPQWPQWPQWPQRTRWQSTLQSRGTESSGSRVREKRLKCLCDFSPSPSPSPSLLSLSDFGLFNERPLRRKGFMRTSSKIRDADFTNS